ncbi:MAG TPA: ATPase domain-containing protein, partial [Solirubrobacteraceae bacterium]|nr:ATPase domain-containing protein [Solirubrobacteraceae bacterium]
HGSDEYPFTIDAEGFSVLPLTSLGLEHLVSNERVSTGVSALDGMLSGAGYYRGSTVLVSGSPGSGKSSLGAAFLENGCARGDRALLFAFEESPEQVVRNMRSIGIDLETPRAAGALRIISARPSAFGLETHLGDMHRAVEKFAPDLVAIDPVSGLTGHDFEIASTLTRVIDLLKSAGITAVLTAMTSEDSLSQDVGISSLIDTWIMLAYEQSGGKRERHISVVKSRGMAHSNELRPFKLTDHGIEILSASRDDE